jgi:hypothetical protein
MPSIDLPEDAVSRILLYEVTLGKVALAGKSN